MPYRLNKVANTLQLKRVLWDLAEDIAVACSCRLKTHEGCTFFCIRLTRLRDQLATYFSLEEAFGYFDGRIDFAPRLSDTADKLLQEHAQLQHRVSELVTYLDVAQPRSVARRLHAGSS